MTNRDKTNSRLEQAIAEAFEQGDRDWQSRMLESDEFQKFINRLITKKI